MIAWDKDTTKDTLLVNNDIGWSNMDFDIVDKYNNIYGENTHTRTYPL